MKSGVVFRIGQPPQEQWEMDPKTPLGRRARGGISGGLQAPPPSSGLRGQTLEFEEFRGLGHGANTDTYVPKMLSGATQRNGKTDSEW